MRLSLVLWGVGVLLFSCSEDPIDRGEGYRGGSGATVEVISGGAPSGGHRAQASGGHRAVAGGASVSTGGSSAAAGGAAHGDVAGAGGALPSTGGSQAIAGEGHGDDGGAAGTSGGAGESANAGAGGLAGDCILCVPGEACRTPRCGDGFVDSWCDGRCIIDIIEIGPHRYDPRTRNANREHCDDGNTEAGDGCFECEVEAGYICPGGHDCYPRGCGDGFRDVPSGQGGAHGAGEECDDGNQISGDGCSAACEDEYGDCGDGVTDILEECDDGNTATGDGCSAACTVESNWACASDSCHEIVCGDGRRDARINAPDEQCDDGNLTDGDGCDSACRAEAGFSCTDTGCHPVECGDGRREGANEQCDDGNDGNGDGCDSTCRVEAGFACEVDSCHPVRCGDGIWDSVPERCDDGNTTNGDGCDSNCQSESGWDCQTGICVRLPKCALGTGTNHCNDGNEVSGDGCSDDCVIEPGYICEPLGGCHQARCGDGIVDEPEECDDGNTFAHDGCTNCRADRLLCGRNP